MEDEKVYKIDVRKETTYSDELPKADADPKLKDDGSAAAVSADTAGNPVAEEPILHGSKEQAKKAGARSWSSPGFGKR